MHDEREWHQCAAAAEIARASESEDLALSSCNSDHTSDDARGPTDCEYRAATDTVPIIPSSDQRPGADLPHFAQLSRKTPRTLLVLSGKIRTAFLEAVTASPADTRKSLSAAQVKASAQSTQLATAHQATTASQGELKFGRRLTPAPETSPASVQGWSVRDVYGETVVLVGADRVWTVRLGDYVPGVGRIDSITRWGSHWIVVTTSGLISTQ
jgi:hypothetical protein